MTRKVDTITTLTEAVIKYKASELSGTPALTDDEKYEKRMNLTEEIINSYVSELSFVETMIFAQTLCDNYSIGDTFPPEQRSEPLSTVDDWRDAATGGLYHLILDAIQTEANNNQHGYTKYETFGNKTTPEAPTSSTDEPEQSHDKADVYTEADANLYRVLEYDPEHVKAIGNNIISDIINSEEPTSTIGSIEKLHNSDFIIKTLVINYITEATGFEQWSGMSDTSCREDFAYTTFTTVIDVVISEFVAFYNPDDEHEIPQAIKD